MNIIDNNFDLKPLNDISITGEIIKADYSDIEQINANLRDFCYNCNSKDRLVENSISSIICE